MSDNDAPPGANAADLGDGIDPDAEDFLYDEFAWFSENCAEYDLAWDGQAEVERVQVPAGDLGDLSMLRWGSGHPEVVFLHGSAQNAHTWDTVALAMGQPPALAVDLPGHGRSLWRKDGRYDPHSNADTVLAALESVLEQPVLLVGMSLGGLTANRVSKLNSDLVTRQVVVDITPGVTRDKAKEIHDFIAGPQTFASFSEIFERTVEFNPTRSKTSLRRGILHNAHRLDDGSWEWNYDRAQPDGGTPFPERDDLWADVAATKMPYLLTRGADSPVVDDDDVAELRRQRPAARVEMVEAAGHSIQGDQPVVLAGMLSAELDA
ncbi:MAG: alpha/beta hydrolase [Actinomycetia bacterium]|nr:alpha/beta hydrolase [Actinomycetes bacterium]